MPDLKVAVIGSRSFTSYKLFCNKLYELLGNTRPHFISGGAEGPDSMAQKYAQEMGYSITIHYPDWLSHQPSDPGKKNPAAMIRNRRIIEECEWVIAFYDDESPGTRGALEMAERLGKKVDVVMVKAAQGG